MYVPSGSAATVSRPAGSYANVCVWTSAPAAVRHVSVVGRPASSYVHSRRRPLRSVAPVRSPRALYEYVAVAPSGSVSAATRPAAS